MWFSGTGEARRFRLTGRRESAGAHTGEPRVIYVRVMKMVSLGDPVASDDANASRLSEEQPVGGVAYRAWRDRFGRRRAMGPRAANEPDSQVAIGRAGLPSETGVNSSVPEAGKLPQLSAVGERRRFVWQPVERRGVLSE